MNYPRAMVEAANAPEQPHWDLPVTPLPTPKRLPTRRERIAVIVERMAGAVGVQEVQVLSGLLLVGFGCRILHPAAGYIVPGAVLLWWSLPQRPRFLQPKPPDVRVVLPGDTPKRERE